MMETAELTTKNLQLWPSGQGVQIRSDGAVRANKWGETNALPFEPPAPELARQIEIEERAEGYMRHEVLACQSSLVDDLMQDDRDGFQVDDVTNLYPDPESMDLEACRSYLDDRGITLPDPEPWAMTAAELLDLLKTHDMEPEDEADEADLRNLVVVGMDEEEIDGLKAYRETVSDNAEPQEVYEWWLVSSWLAGQLKEIGEPVLDNDYGYWWGRTCTGQGMIMDGTLQEIAAKWVREPAA